ncbi:MAG: UDP-N-acetylmuramate--L-alanine ligase [Bacteroidales bacterium]|nr:UDP-N-acetylmuramate--L-alanine ligase [Bacteroidales bacterium]
MRVYFLGIGGIGMSAIARYLNTKGDEVMGYDRTKSNLTEQLEKEGIKINYEDIKENVPSDIDLCIYTPAIPENSIQLNYIKQLGIPMEKRSVALGHITKGKKVLAVAGSHGKTTTCGMIAHILSNSPYGCSAFLGGILKSIDSNFIYNKDSEFVVAEADEYDRSFLQLSPFASVITAIDEDHMDIYHTYENLHNAFEQFAQLTDKNGLLLVRIDRERLIEDLKDKTPLQTYSLTDIESDNYIWNLRISKGSYYFDYKHKDGVWYDMQMTYPGLHNVENAVAALSVCNFALQSIGVDKQEREKILREGLKTFSGMQRRLDFRIKSSERIFIDDYAHHPQEISSTIESLRQMYPNERLTGIFQPHLYSRTRDLADEFADALTKLDEVILLPIYPAREEPIEGVDSHMILHKINKMDKYLVTKEQLFPLLEALNPKFLITFGAGDIDRLVPEIETLLNE